MVGYRPCQLQLVMLVLLLVRFCCWYCCTEAAGTSFLVGNSSAAIVLQSDREPAHGSPGSRCHWRPERRRGALGRETRVCLKPAGF